MKVSKSKKILVAKPAPTSKRSESRVHNYQEDNGVIIIHDGTPDYLALLEMQEIVSNPN